MALSFSFDQVKIAKNENVNNSVLNRALARIYSMLQEMSISVAFPNSDATEITYLADIYSEVDGRHYREWHPISKIAANLPKPKLTELSDVSKIIPTNGYTVVWNSTNQRWEFKKLPTKINDLNKFSLVDENPVDNSVMTWNSTLNSWVAQTVSKYIGVGYIYHQVCSRPTVVRLPTSSTALSGGEQIVITKLRPVDAESTQRIPVLVTVPDNSATIVGRQSIIANNENEDFSSIHLRATLGPDGNYMWVPVCSTGTWRFTDKTDLTAVDSGNTAIDRPPALTENQIKLQPYNIDIEFNIDGEDVSRSFDVVLSRITSSSAWTLVSPTSDYVYYSPVTNIVTINHNILNGTRLVRGTVFYESESKLSQITPNEVYFEKGLSSQYGSMNFDLHEWLDNATENTIKFKILISI